MKSFLTFFFKVQPHLKKCFDNIKSLKMAKVSEPNQNVVSLVLHGLADDRISVT